MVETEEQYREEEETEVKGGKESERERRIGMPTPHTQYCSWKFHWHLSRLWDEANNKTDKIYRQTYKYIGLQKWGNEGGGNVKEYCSITV